MSNVQRMAGHNKKKEYMLLSLVVLFKILLAGLFSSDYQDAMFIPFVDTFLQGKNPYEYYFMNRLISSFPYPPLMLFIESAAGILLTWFNPEMLFFRNLIFKLPLFFFDLIGYLIIRKMKIRFKYAFLFYFCSPIIFYGTYMHGQLDVIPTTLLIIAIYYLTSWKVQNNLLYSAGFLGISLSTKLHILAALPVLIMYVASKRGYKEAVKYLFITFIPVFIFTIGFWKQGFIETVLLNKEQSVLLTVGMDYGTTRMLFPILVLMILYFKVFELNYFNKELLITVLGFLFAVFLVCVPPMPGWFTWIVPFVTLYFGYVMTERYKVMFVYAGFNLLYTIYFIFLHQKEYVDLYILGRSLQSMKFGGESVRNVAFTLMAALLGMVVYEIYQFGIASNGLYRRGNIPFTIGIAGDSGAGKSSLLDKMKALFGDGEEILFIEGDGDHRWERNDKNWSRFTALDPRANYLYRQANDIKALRTGNHVERTDYNHDAGNFTDKYLVKPRKYIVLCGLHSLYLPQLRNELDLKIFMDTDNELRKFWKLERDVNQRGHVKEETVSQIDERIPDAEKYIYPQKQYADMVITYFDKTMKNYLDEGHKVVLSVKLDLDINMDLENIIHCFWKYDVHPDYNISGNFLRQEITFDGEELKEAVVDYEYIAERCIPQYEDLFVYKPKWGRGLDGVVQVFLLIIISSKMRG